MRPSHERSGLDRERAHDRVSLAAAVRPGCPTPVPESLRPDARASITGSTASSSPKCTSCHVNVGDPADPLWPLAASCAECHDGGIEETVSWRPPTGPPATNLRFTHADHAKAVRGASGADSLLDCRSCHAQPDADRMQVRLAVAQNCLDCHGIRAQHLSAPDSSCATCHVPLAGAVRLTRADVAEFPAPESHKARDFDLEGHGRLAKGTGTSPVAAACATCHARDFCSECHVNAPEVAAIQALAPDPRSLAIKTEPKAPPQPHGSGLPAAARICLAQVSGIVRHLSYPGKLSGVPLRKADGCARPAGRRPGPRERRGDSSGAPGFTRRGFCRPAWSGGRRASGHLQRLPCPFAVPGLPPP